LQPQAVHGLVDVNPVLAKQFGAIEVVWV
jgi:hypothetical protein